ncbi:Nuclear receptor-binding protein [Dirofilaria immitis]|nr:Nuclear receptor-binding protein [Dirofilaria immitis]
MINGSSFTQSFISNFGLGFVFAWSTCAQHFNRQNRAIEETSKSLKQSKPYDRHSLESCSAVSCTGSCIAALASTALYCGATTIRSRKETKSEIETLSICNCDSCLATTIVSMNSATSTNVGPTVTSHTTDTTVKLCHDTKGGNNSKDSDSEGEGAEELRIGDIIFVGFVGVGKFLPICFLYIHDIKHVFGYFSFAFNNGEILEESPCKRWSKRREQAKQRNVPGIDYAYLAMDNETGNEVVWNEVLFSERKNFRSQEEHINSVFDKLTHLVHTNLVKFHKYWTDSKSDKPRIIFITEYMSSGSLARFLQRTRKSGAVLNLKAWKKWTTQILSALNYLHSCNPPVVHANLTCNTMFIQHNGLIKIGCVAPTAIQHHVKTFQENIRNMHYIAPEYEHCNAVAPPADIYSFGICALEMALPMGLCGSSNGTETSVVSQEMVRRGLESLEDPMQKDFIESCLNQDPSKRPTARDLLFHTILLEVHSLKLLAAHSIVSSKLNDSLNEDDLHVDDPNRIAATSGFREMAYNQVPSFQIDLEKFLEDVSNGIYPLIAFTSLTHHQRMTVSTSSSAVIGEQQCEDRGSDGDKPEPTPSPPADSPLEYKEGRSIIKCTVTLNGSLITLIVQLDDMMNRQLTAKITDSDTPSILAAELVQHGLIAEACYINSDEAKVEEAFMKALSNEITDSILTDEKIVQETSTSTQ